MIYQSIPSGNHVETFAIRQCECRCLRKETHPSNVRVRRRASRKCCFGGKTASHKTKELYVPWQFRDVLQPAHELRPWPQRIREEWHPDGDYNRLGRISQSDEPQQLHWPCVQLNPLNFVIIEISYSPSQNSLRRANQLLRLRSTYRMAVPNRSNSKRSAVELSSSGRFASEEVAEATRS